MNNAPDILAEYHKLGHVPEDASQQEHQFGKAQRIAIRSYGKRQLLARARRLGDSGTAALVGSYLRAGDEIAAERVMARQARRK